jgi:hypothetical protein
VELGDVRCVVAARDLHALFRGVTPGSRGLDVVLIGAEFAPDDANVRGVQVPVDVVVGVVAVAAFTVQVGEQSDRQEVGALEQRQAVLRAQSFAGIHFPGDVRQVDVDRRPLGRAVTIDVLAMLAGHGVAFSGVGSA